MSSIYSEKYIPGNILPCEWLPNSTYNISAQFLTQSHAKLGIEIEIDLVYTHNVTLSQHVNTLRDTLNRDICLSKPSVPPAPERKPIPKLGWVSWYGYKLNLFLDLCSK